jgi:hypothetical protein
MYGTWPQSKIVNASASSWSRTTRSAPGSSRKPASSQAHGARGRSSEALLTSLGQLIQQSSLSPPEKESGQRILKRIVLNFFERRIDIDDDWAELEEI